MVHSVAMTARVRTARISRITVISSTIRKRLATPVRLSHLSKTRECEQVAAVCFRVRRGAVEFLLVQTRGSGRWIFPKGSAEPGLTHAQAAAIEAFEEAGVHGRIEETAFVRYVCRRQSARRKLGRSAAKSLVVSAHLCEVLRLCNPKEPNRNRTWFSIEETVQHLREGRKKEDGEEFARVVRQAVARITWLRSASDTVVDRPHRPTAQDELHRVQFEAVPQTQRIESARRFALPAGHARFREIVPCEVLPFHASRHPDRTPHLLSSAVKVKALGVGAKNG
jgi:8-oxo-dGTP pyrophosphatase MutT (NUDIX family)